MQCFLARSVLLELVFVLHPCIGFSEDSATVLTRRSGFDDLSG